MTVGHDPVPVSSPRDLSARFLVVVLYFVVAAAAYSGFFAKWQMWDDRPAFSLAAVLDGTAIRPWVYRQLLPGMANGIERALPEPVKQRVLEVIFSGENRSTITKITTTLARDPQYTLRYHLILYMTFGFFLAGLFLLRAVCVQATGDVLAGTLAPLAFALLLPILQTIGGFYYDFVELFFMAAAAYAVLQRHWIALGLLALLATTNKESFLFFAFALYPLLRVHLTRQRALQLVALVSGIGGATYMVLRVAYAGNPGYTAIRQLSKNLAFYANPLSLFKLEWTYNVIMFTGYNPIVLLVIALVIKKGWSGLESPWKRHFLAAAAINLPLLILFCAPGEMRNLSLCYIAFAVTLTTALSRWIAELTPPRASARVIRAF